MVAAILLALLILAPGAARAVETRSCDGLTPLQATAQVLCLAPSGPCTATTVTMSTSIDVPDGVPCTFDLGGRDLVVDRTLNVTGKFGVNFQGAIIVENAANITTTSTGKLKARGDFVEPFPGFVLPGGDIELNASGDVSHDGLIEILGSPGGTVTINAGGNVVFENGSELKGNGIGPATEGERDGDGGTLRVATGADFIVDGTVTMNGQNQGEGGVMTLTIGDDLELRKNVELTGGASGGGEFEATVTGDVLIKRRLWIDSTVADGDGGSVEIEAGGNIVAESPANLSGVGHSSNAFGGSGGSFDLIALGSVVIGQGVVVRTSAGNGFDGEGGFLDIQAALDVVFDGDYTSRSSNIEGFGGFFGAVAGRDLTIGGDLDLGGKDGGGEVDADGGRGVTVSGNVAAEALDSAGEGGVISFAAGRHDDNGGLGIVRLEQDVLFRAGASNAANSPMNVRACGLVIDANVKVDGSGGPIGGAKIAFATRRSAQVAGSVQLLAPSFGSIVFTHPTGAAPIIAAGATITPAAGTVVSDDLSLYPDCPICGDDIVQPSEVCDKGAGAQGACCSADCSEFVCPTATPTGVPTATPTATLTATPTVTPTATSTFTPVATVTVTSTATPVATVTVTSTPTSGTTATPTVTATATGSTPTATPTPTVTLTSTPSPTVTATATGAPTATPTVTATATPTVTGSATPSATAVTPTPTATPDAFLHLLDPKTAKAAAKCQAEINKRANKFLEKVLKSLGKCAGAAFKCIQTKTGEKRDGCLAKAGGRCGKELARITKEQGKLTDKIVARCDGSVGGGNMRSQAGLGYESLETECELGALDQTAADVAACVAASYQCHAETLFERHMPRAQELMEIAGVPDVDRDRFGCLGAHGGAGEDLNDPSDLGKLAQKCQDAIAKAGVKLEVAELKGQGKCLDKLYRCVQTKPGDAACLTKADRTCDKEQAKLLKARAKLDSSIDRKCADLVFAAAVRPAFGINVAALDVGVGETLDTLDKYEDAVRTQAQCVSEELLAIGMPRLSQMLSLQDPPVSFPSAGCL